jgi:O-antigen ligase
MATRALQPPATTPAFRTGLPVAAACCLAAGLIGVLLARDFQIGIAMLLGALYVPIALLNLPLAIVLWTPLLFIDRLPQLSFAPTLVGLTLLAAWLVALPPQRAYVRAVVRANRTVFVLLGLALAWMAISAIWASDPARVASDYWKWVGATVSLLVVATTIGRRHLPVVIAAYAIGAALSVIGVFAPGSTGQVADVNADVEVRLGGGIVDPNFLAAGIVPAMALVGGLIRWVRSPGARWLLAGLLLFLAIGLLATGSRGGLIAASVALVVTLALSRGQRLQLGAAAALMIVLGGFWVATSSPESWERIRSFDTGSGREDLWQIAWSMSEDHPVNGVGLNNFREVSGDYFRQPGRLGSPELILEDPRVVHNTYLQALAETGVVGLILLCGCMLACVGATWRAGRELERGGDHRLAVLASSVLTAQIAALTASFFLSNGRDDRLWFLLALGPTLLVAARRVLLDRAGAR